MTTLVPAMANQQDLGNRAGRGLADGQRTSDQPDVLHGERAAEANPALELPETYIPRAIIRLLPHLVDDLADKKSYAFVTYDHGRRGLVARVIKCQGEDSSSGIASKGGVYRLDDREGLAAEPSKLYVDRSGRTLRVEAGPLTMTRVDGDEINTVSPIGSIPRKGGWPNWKNRRSRRCPRRSKDQQAILPLENQHRIPVAEEAVVLRDRLPDRPRRPPPDRRTQRPKLGACSPASESS